MDWKITKIENLDDKSKIVKSISESKDIMELNFRLMQLENVEIPGSTKSFIIDTVKKPISRLVKYKFQTMMLEDKLNSAIRNPDLWLKTCFSHLDSMAAKSNE